MRKEDENPSHLPLVLLLLGWRLTLDIRSLTRPSWDTCTVDINVDIVIIVDHPGTCVDTSVNIVIVDTTHKTILGHMRCTVDITHKTLLRHALTSVLTSS